MNHWASRSEIEFPDPRLVDESGLVYVGGQLSVSNIVRAYQHGIFPWPMEGYPMLWFCPKQRGVLDFKSLHLPRRLKREMRQSPCLVTMDRAFVQVIEACSTVPRGKDGGTWILPELKEAYINLFAAGHAHSVECWNGGVLVGGLYGVYIDGVFSGESMFFRESNTSKFSLLFLVQYLQKLGLQWLDIQMVTPVLESLGGKYIDQVEYLRRVEEAQKVAVPFTPMGGEVRVTDICDTFGA